MSAILSIIMKMFSDVFASVTSDVLIDQLNSLGETTEIENEKGVVEIDVDLSSLINELDGVNDL